ncbi:MAG: 30S ribosomal protein S20 [Candidatus Paceibacterota bacterium]|jgi:small subunit ribosomal protein S20
MPITSSAKKALRASKRKRVFNLRRQKASDELVKQIRKLVAQKKVSEAKALLPKAYQALDKSAKMKTIKKNTASRKKSRLAKLLKKNS